MVRCVESNKGRRGEVQMFGITSVPSSDGRKHSLDPELPNLSNSKFKLNLTLNSDRL